MTELVAAIQGKLGGKTIESALLKVHHNSEKIAALRGTGYDILRKVKLLKEQVESQGLRFVFTGSDGCPGTCKAKGRMESTK